MRNGLEILADLEQTPHYAAEAKIRDVETAHLPPEEETLRGSIGNVIGDIKEPEGAKGNGQAQADTDPEDEVLGLMVLDDYAAIIPPETECSEILIYEGLIPGYGGFDYFSVPAIRYDELHNE